MRVRVWGWGWTVRRLQFLGKELFQKIASQEKKNIKQFFWLAVEMSNGKNVQNWTTHVDESDTGPDRIWSDPTIRRNAIGIRVAEQLTDPTVIS